MWSDPVRDRIKQIVAEYRGQDDELTANEVRDEQLANQIASVCRQNELDVTIFSDYSDMAGTLIFRVEETRQYAWKMRQGHYNPPEMDFWRIYIVPPPPKSPDDIEIIGGSALVTAYAMIDRMSNPMPTTIRFSRPINRDEVEKYILWEIYKEAGLTEIPRGSFYIPFRPNHNSSGARGRRGIDTLEPVDIDAILEGRI